LFIVYLENNFLLQLPITVWSVVVVVVIVDAVVEI